MAILEVKPYNDPYMYYDYTFRQYVLNPDAIVDLLNISLDEWFTSSEEAKVALLEQSNRIYNYIYMYKKPEQFQKMRYLLATSPHFREGMKLCLLAQMRYFLQSMGDSISLQHGVNIDKAQNVDVEVLRGELQIALEAHQIAYRYGMLNHAFYDGNRYSTELVDGVDW
jgi:hypothetical protein